MRNWHTKVIKLQEARAIISNINGLNQFGNPDLYIGVIEGKIEYSAIDPNISKNDFYNYKSPNKHLNYATGDRKIIYRDRYDENFYEEGLNSDANEMQTMTHTTCVVGIIAGNNISYTNGNINVSDNVFGICPDSKIINSADEFEVSLLLTLINSSTKGNINSYYYNKNILIKNSSGGIIEGTGYLDTKKIPLLAKDPSNNLSNKKCSIISCSYTIKTYPDDNVNGMTKEIADFIFQELYAYGRDGRGILMVFAAGNENVNINNIYSCSANSSKPLIVAASKVTIDQNNMSIYNASSIVFDEGKANYSNYGKRVDICAPSCPVGKSAKDEIEIYAPTAINCGEIGDNDQVLSIVVLHKDSSTKLILDDKYEVVFAGQSIEIGNPTTFAHEVRFITNVEKVQYPSNPNPDLNIKTKITLNQPIVFTDGVIESASVKICVFKKSVEKFSASQIKLDNFKGIGNFQLPSMQKAYLYSEDSLSPNDFSVGMLVTLKNNLSSSNIIDIVEQINLPRLTNLKLIPGQITAKIIQKTPGSNFYLAKTDSSLQGFFSGQQVFIEEEGVKRHLKFVVGTGATTLMQFSQLSSEPSEDGSYSSNEYTIKSLGYGNMTSSFGGTSAATPIVSGVAALVLSSNSNLNATEIKHILKISADKIDNINSYNDAPSDILKYNYGYNINKYYGTGRVNAERAVQLALDWHDPAKYGTTVLKPRLEIADKLVGTTITNVTINEPVDSPDIWVSELANSNSAPVAPFNQVDTKNKQYINIKVRNTGNRNSFKECDLRVFVAFTDDVNPAFPFPMMWFDQTEVKLLAVKEIPIIPPGNEAILQVEWEDIAAKWNGDWNPVDRSVGGTGKRKRAYILAHIAPFDGLPTEVQVDNIRNNKQLTCKEIIVTHNGVNDRTAYLPGNNLNITVGSEVIAKNFDFTMENILTTDLTVFKIKATKANNDVGNTSEVVYYKKTGTTWAFETAPSSNWIAFDTPIEIVGNHPDYTNLKFPHTIRVNEDQIRVKLEVVTSNI